ncbi:MULTISPECIES: hypothetical protein [unclassified Nocardiopsis]|uniref:hypothetical protein n=1 Tax=Nocardiopsis TaxID=2013 RepID=UPI00387B040F
MRTTIDLPPELHRQAMSIARDQSRTLSDIVAELMRRGLTRRASEGEVVRSARTGLPTISLGTVITTEDVRELEDED